MESLNVKNINDEKIFNVIDPNGQGEVVNRIRPISVSINQKAETINDQTDSTINLAVYWNDTWKSILDLTFDESLRQEYGKLTQDLTNIQKDIDMKQYKDAETKTADFLKYVANLSSKYTAIPEKAVVSKTKNDFVKVIADKNSVKATISDKLLNFMLKKYAKVDTLDYTKANECFSTSKFNFLANNYDFYYHSPEIFQKQAYMTVVKDNKVVGSYKVNYDQFSKFASKFMLTPQKLGYSKDRLAGYMKTAEVVMQNIFFDSVDEAKEWQEMVDEKKKEQATTPEGEEETTETTTTETKTEMGKGKSESPIKEDGGLARPSEDFASDEIPESEPRQQEQQGGGQNLGASKRVKNVKKVAGKKLWVEVIYGKGKDDYWVTDMNPNVTDEEVRKYFTGQSFNIDHGFDEKGQPIEKFVRPYEVIIHREDEKQANKNKNVKKTARVGYNAEPENELEEKAVKIGDEIMNVEWDFGEEIQNLEDILEEKPKNKKVIEERISVLKGKRIEAIKKVVEKYNKEFANKEIADLVYEHLQDNNAHKANSIVLSIVNGKQSSKKVKLNKKANKEYVVTDEWQVKNSKGELVTEKMEEELSAQGLINFAIERWDADYEEDFKEEDIKNVDVAKRFLEYIGFKVSKQANKSLKLNKKALYGDVQEQDIVPAKTETKVYLQSEKVEDFVWLINGSGRIEILAPKALVMGATGSGDNSEGVNKLRDYIKKDLEKISVEEMQKTVSEYGIENVKEMDKDELERYLVWLLAGDTADNLENRLADEEDLENIKAKNNPNVQKKAEEQTVEEKIEEAETSDMVKGKIGVGDIVTVCIDKLEYPEEAFKYTELIGEPLILMENDKEDINKVIVEQTEYPFQRMTVNKDDICQYAELQGADIVVEDVDGDEMITTFEELPVVAKQCKIKSIHKAANINKKKANLTKKAINSLEDVAGLIDDILSDYDWYDYADQLEVGEKSHYENILADLQKDEKGTIEALFNRVSENDEEYSSPKIEQLKEYYNNKFSDGRK